MSMIFTWRMLSDEDDNFVRDYEVPYDMNLLDFHKFICEDLGYEDSTVSSFFLSDQMWVLRDKRFKDALNIFDLGHWKDDVAIN